MLCYTHNLRLLLFSLIGFFLTNLNLSAQEEDLKEVYLEANSNFLYEEYKEALPLFQKILRYEPDNYNVLYKIGVCYLKDRYQKYKSIDYLVKASGHVNIKYNTNSYKEKMAPPEAAYYLGEAYRVNGYLDKAIETYSHFKKTYDPEVFDMKVVDEQLNSCFIAKELMKHPVYYIPENAGEVLNSRFADIDPVISGDGKHMVFTTKLAFYDAVFYASKKENGEWNSPVNLTPDFGVDGNSYSTGISYHGDEIFVYRSDNFDGNIYSSRKIDGKWQKLTKLNENINTRYWESHASLSPDGKTLYFTSNRRGGYGGLDIYTSKRNKNGEWGEAVNMGPVINSEYNEETPFLTNDGYTLYFSSQGHYNMGGYDIFFSNLLSNGSWAKPLNVGYPLNTTDDDLFFDPYGDGYTAYYSMYNPDNTMGLTDIFRIELFNDQHPRKFILHGKTNLKESAKQEELTARLYDVKSGDLVDQATLNEDGSYTLEGKQGTFKVVVEGKNYSAVSGDIVIPINNPSDNFDLPLLTLTETKAEKIELQIQKQSSDMAFIDMKERFLVVNDTLPVEIPISFRKNATLNVRKTLNGKLIGDETRTLNRKKYTYYYKPHEGVNALTLTITDDEGNIATDEIIISCRLEPEPEESITSMQPTEVKLGDIAALADGKLREYLMKLDISDVESSDALYELLKKGLENGEFSLEELITFYSKYYSQKSAAEFYNEMTEVSHNSLKKELQNSYLDSLKSVRSVAYTFAVDVEEHGKKGFYESEEVKQAYADIISQNRSIRQVWDLLRTGIDENKTDISSIDDSIAEMKDIDDLLNSIESLTGRDELIKLLRFVSTSIDCNAYFFDLLFAANANIKKTLSDIRLERDSIYSSEDLVKYMFQKAGKDYTLEELVKLLNEVKSERFDNIKIFYEILTMKATGNLKSKLQSIENQLNQFNSRQELIEYLLNQSNLHQYTKENVYRLLLDLIKPESVENFAFMLEKYANNNIRKAIAAADIYQFSTPFEFLQYLLSYTDEYNYSETDIINLLLRLILEKGLDDEYSALLLSQSQAEKSGKISKLAQTIILASIVFILGIIIILLRRRKK